MRFFKIVAVANHDKIRDYVCSPIQLVKYPHLIKNILKSDYQVQFLFPLPPIAVNLHAEDVEGSIKPFAHKFGMYEGMDAMLEHSRFAWLPGCVDPYMPKEKLEAASFYLTALFDNDDGIDLKLLTDKNLLQEFRDGNVRVMSVFDGKGSSDSDVPRVKAMEHIYREYFQPLIAKGVDFKFFQKTLDDYLQSTILEISAHQSGNMHEQFYLENRQNTGGAGNAFALMCFLNEIHLEPVFQQFVQLKYMLRMMVDAVGILNDLYSLPKELKEIQKKIKLEGKDPDDIEEIKKYVSSNIVLIKWKGGVTMDSAISESVNEYEKRIQGFCDAKNLFSKEELSNHELQKTIYGLMGWLFGHPCWALGSGRYNDYATLNSNDYVQFLEGLNQYLS